MRLTRRQLRRLIEGVFDDPTLRSISPAPSEQDLSDWPRVGDISAVRAEERDALRLVRQLVDKLQAMGDYGNQRHADALYRQMRGTYEGME